MCYKMFKEKNIAFQKFFKAVFWKRLAHEMIAFTETTE